MWEHTKSRHQYTELREGPPELARSRRGLLAKSATTGRWVWVGKAMLREIQTPESLAEAEEFVRREHLQHLAWQLSRELPYNLGTAITNMALSGHGGSLLTALGALRDEIERTSHPGTQPPTEEETS